MDYLSFTYAFAITAGGVFGYVKAGSVASLVSGLIFGGLSALGAYNTSHNPSDGLLLISVCASLGGLMSYRAVNSGKIMPAGGVAILSILMVLRLLPRVLAKLH